MLYLFPLCRTIHESIKKFPFYDENKTVCKLSIKSRVTKKCVFIKNTLGSISLEHKYHLFRDAFRIHSADKLFMLFFNNV